MAIVVNLVFCNNQEAKKPLVYKKIPLSQNIGAYEFEWYERSGKKSLTPGLHAEKKIVLAE